MRTIIFVASITVLVFSIISPAAASTADLLDALAAGDIQAEFRGTGGSGVEAYLQKQPGGPDYVNISPGTQFWAQRDGLQGQTTLGWQPVRMGADGTALVQIPTACTNIDRPTPTTNDRLWPSACPDERMARLCSTLRPKKQSGAVMQLAVWAIANDPSRRQLRSHERDLVAEESKAREHPVIFGDLLREAAGLLDAAGLQPHKYRMFRGIDIGRE